MSYPAFHFLPLSFSLHSDRLLHPDLFHLVLTNLPTLCLKVSVFPLVFVMMLKFTKTSQCFCLLIFCSVASIHWKNLTLTIMKLFALDWLVSCLLTSPANDSKCAPEPLDISEPNLPSLLCLQLGPNPCYYCLGNGLQLLLFKLHAIRIVGVLGAHRTNNGIF